MSNKSKDKIRDKTKQKLVEVYQQGVRQAITELTSQEGKMSPQRKQYIIALEENIRRAPYLLGYLYWPEDKTKKSN